MSTEELIERCIKKDGSAWEEFIRKYQSLVRKAVYYRLHNVLRNDVDDIVQEVFLALWKDDKLSSLRDVSRLKGWLADQENTLDRRKKVRGLHGACDDFQRGEIPPHCINGDAHRAARRQLLDLDGQHLSSLVGSTGEADPVRQLRSAALRTVLERWHRVYVMRLPHADAHLGLSPFRYRHSSLPLYCSANPSNAPPRGAVTGGHRHASRLRLLPHRGHSPRHVARHNGCVGRASKILSLTSDVKSTG